MRAITSSVLAMALFLFVAPGCVGMGVPPSRGARLGGTGRAQADRPSTDEGGQPSPLTHDERPSHANQLAGVTPPAELASPTNITAPVEVASPPNVTPPPDVTSTSVIALLDLASSLDFLSLHRVVIPRVVVSALLSIAPDDPATHLVMAAVWRNPSFVSPTGPRRLRLPPSMAIEMLRAALDTRSTLHAPASSPSPAAPLTASAPRSP